MPEVKPQLLSITRTAELLGVSRPTVYRWVEDGLLVASKWLDGKTPLFSSEEVERVAKVILNKKAVQDEKHGTA